MHAAHSAIRQAGVNHTELRILADRIRSSAALLADESPSALCNDRAPAGFRSSASHLRPFLSVPSLYTNGTESYTRWALAQVPALWANRNDPSYNATHDVESAALLCEAFARRMKEATAGVAKPAAPWLASWRLDRGRRFPRCAVVGGSGGLLGGGAGRRIDAHDAVFRTNDAPTQDKYAADVGTRTHFRVGSHFNWRAHLAQQVARNATGGPTTSVLYCFNPYVGQCETEAMTLGLRPNPKRGHPAYMLNPALISALNTMEKLFSRRPRSPRRMLTGNAAVAMALAMCERVDLFGFGNDSDATEATGALCAKYYSCSTPQSAYFRPNAKYHDKGANWEVLNWLANHGYVRYHSPRGGVPEAIFAVVNASDNPRRWAPDKRGGHEVDVLVRDIW